MPGRPRRSFHRLKIPLEVIYFSTAWFSVLLTLTFPPTRTALRPCFITVARQAPYLPRLCTRFPHDILNSLCRYIHLLILNRSPEIVESIYCGCVITVRRSSCFVQSGECSAVQQGDMAPIRQTQAASCSALPRAEIWSGPGSLINPGVVQPPLDHIYIYPSIYPHPERLPQS